MTFLEFAVPRKKHPLLLLLIGHYCPPSRIQLAMQGPTLWPPVCTFVFSVRAVIVCIRRYTLCPVFPLIAVGTVINCCVQTANFLPPSESLIYLVLWIHQLGLAYNTIV